jgi:YjbE family integral membrane protein
MPSIDTITQMLGALSAPSYADVAAFIQVVLLDLALAGDNAVAVGLAAAALPREQQRRVIFWGIALALILRIVFATGVKWMLQFDGILLFGGMLLLWVAFRMWQDLSAHKPVQVLDPHMGEQAAAVAAGPPPTTFGRALLTIVIADVSMSLDNVLAVAGVARNSADWILWFGLALAVVLMGVAATIIARVIETNRWIAWLGIAIIIIAGGRMIWEDLHHFFPAYVPGLPGFLAAPHPAA